MDNSFWKLLTGYGTKVTIEKGVVLSVKGEGDAASPAYLLEDGICALTSFTKQGEEKVFLYFHPRRIICFNQLVVSERRLTHPRPEFSIVTKTRCVLYRIAPDVFKNLVVRNSAFNAFLMETLADNYSEALAHFHRMQEESATSSLCRLLLDVSQLKQKTRVVPKFFTYSELAKYLGSHPVTVSRIMAKLKQCGYITKTPCGITIEREDALKELVNSESCFKY